MNIYLRKIANFLFFIAIFLTISYCIRVKPDPTIWELESRVVVGDTREHATQVYSDAWFHTKCRARNSPVIRDLYFYGPRSSDEALIVMVESETVNGKATIRFIGSVDNYLLHIYDYCDPSPTQAFDGE